MQQLLTTYVASNPTTQRLLSSKCPLLITNIARVMRSVFIINSTLYLLLILNFHMVHVLPQTQGQKAQYRVTQMGEFNLWNGSSKDLLIDWCQVKGVISICVFISGIIVSIITYLYQNQGCFTRSFSIILCSSCCKTVTKTSSFLCSTPKCIYVDFLVRFGQWSIAPIPCWS